MNKSVLFTNLSRQLEPSGAFGDSFARDKWRSIPYETPEFSGDLIVAHPQSTVPDLTLSPGLEGWYRIYVGLLNPGLDDDPHLWVRLSGEEGWLRLQAARHLTHHTIDEAFLFCADMTGRSLCFRHPEGGFKRASALASVRLVPMSEEEVAAELHERSRTDTKRIYATEDVHGIFIMEEPRDMEPIYSHMAVYQNTDVKVLAMEYYQQDYNFCTGNDVPPDGEILWAREYEEHAARSFRHFRELGIDPYEKMIAYGHRLGLEMHLSMRIIGTHEFPLDDCFGNPTFDREELWMEDRDGTPVSRLSFAYPEVQEIYLDRFSQMAAYDVEGVDLYLNRGYPFMLFEKPFADAVMADCGEDAKTLPGYDERLIAVRCRIMNDFLRKMRARLDAERAARHQKPIRLTLHVHKNLRGCRFVGIDLPAIAAGHLADTVVVYPLEHYEEFPDEFYTDGTKTKVNPDAYGAKMRQGGPDRFRWGHYDAGLGYTGVRDYDCPQESEAEIREFIDVLAGSGTELYVHLMPRDLPPETARDRAVKLYSLGVDGIGLWDTEIRSLVRRNWQMMARLGHRDELASLDTGEGTLYRNHILKKVGKYNIDRYPPHWCT